MTNYVLSSSYYLVLKNGECIESHLPDQVTYHDSVLTFENKEPIEIQIVYMLEASQHFDISYQVKKFVEVNIIETKLFDNDAYFHKTMAIDEQAIVHIFSENNCINENMVKCLEEVYLKQNALCHCGYSELSDGSYEGIYHYYLDGENAEAKVRMAALSKDTEKKHYEVLIQHNYPHTYGQMDNYGVVKDSGKLVLDGIGTITKGQHGSASHQTNKIMVFDAKCVASANPFLYIDDFDVKASHAAGVGKMDEEHLYYLQSRGLTKKQAMQLITYGYLKPVIEVIENEMLKEHFETVLSKVGA